MLAPLALLAMLSGPVDPMERPQPAVRATPSAAEPSDHGPRVRPRGGARALLGLGGAFVGQAIVGQFVAAGFALGTSRCSLFPNCVGLGFGYAVSEVVSGSTFAVGLPLLLGGAAMHGRDEAKDDRLAGRGRQDLASRGRVGMGLTIAGGVLIVPAAIAGPIAAATACTDRSCFSALATASAFATAVSMAALTTGSALLVHTRTYDRGHARRGRLAVQPSASHSFVGMSATGRF